MQSFEVKSHDMISIEELGSQLLGMRIEHFLENFYAADVSARSAN